MEVPVSVPICIGKQFSFLTFLSSKESGSLGEQSGWQDFLLRKRSHPQTVFCILKDYCTVSVSWVEREIPFDVAVTVSVEMPAGVPFGVGRVLVPEPPAQPLMAATLRTRSSSGETKASLTNHTERGLADRSWLRLVLQSNMATRERSQNTGLELPGVRQRNRRGSEINAPRAVVVTLTFTVAGVPGVTFIVAGTMQVAPCGAPVQVKDRVCGAPVSMICSEKVAALPAVTVAVVVLFCAGATEKSVAVPLSVTV